MPQNLQNLQNIAKFQKFQLDNLVDFEKYCKTRIFLQKSVPIQPKTSNIFPKFCQKIATASSAASAVEAVARRPLQQTGGEVAKDLEVALVQEHDPVVVARELVEQGQRPRQRVHAWVERFDRRGTEPVELFRSEFGQNSWNPKKTTKKHFFEVAADPKDTTGPQEKREKGNKLH